MPEIPPDATESNTTDTTEVLRAIFRIKAGQLWGTGFLVHDNRHILTARHVVERSIQEKIEVHDDKTELVFTARVQKILEKWDAALLLLDEPITDIIPLNLLSYSLESSPKFRTYGFPQAFKRGWFNGEVQGPVSADDRNYEVFIAANLPDQLKGISGAPVFLENAYDVIGIFYWHDLNNPQSGRIVPTAGFFDEAFEGLLNSFEVSFIELDDDPWCFVIRSESDRILEQRRRRHTMKDAVLDAMVLLQDDPRVGRNKVVQFEFATDLVSSQEAYRKTIKKLCKARVAVFDITHFEPAAMLLLGIRSVVKRGITITSYGGSYIIGGALEIPFNIKELTIISHSAEQHKDANKPAYIIHDKISEGLDQLDNLPQYLDLPSFDAVRNLPPDYREPDSNNVLVLCPYSEKYQETNWDDLHYHLDLVVKPKGGRIYRILDLMSPRLVSPTIYEKIRRVVLCIVDWTEWRPNVFFELGVRLAVANKNRFTVCIIDKSYRILMDEVNQSIHDDQSIERFQRDPNKFKMLFQKIMRVDTGDLNVPDFDPLKNRYSLIAQQCFYLLELFNPLEYNPPISDDDLNNEPYDDQFKYDRAQYTNMMLNYPNISTHEVASKDRDGLAPYLTYEEIQERIDPEGEFASVPVYLELLRTAKLFSVDEREAQAAVLYPGNKKLMGSVETGIVQRLLAAWYFLRNEYGEKEILADEKLFEAFKEIGQKLSRLLEAVRPDQSDEIDNFVRSLRKQKEKRL